MPSPLRGLDGWSFYAFERDRVAALRSAVAGHLRVESVLGEVDRWEVDNVIYELTKKHEPA